MSTAAAADSTDKGTDDSSLFNPTIQEVVEVGAPSSAKRQTVDDDGSTSGTPARRFFWSDPVGKMNPTTTSTTNTNTAVTGANHRMSKLLRGTPLEKPSSLRPCWGGTFRRSELSQEGDRLTDSVSAFGTQIANLTPLKRQLDPLLGLGLGDDNDEEDDDDLLFPPPPPLEGNARGVANPWYRRHPYNRPPKFVPPREAFALRWSDREEGPPVKRAKIVDGSMQKKNEDHAENAGDSESASSPAIIPIDLCDSDNEGIQEKKISAREEESSKMRTCSTVASAVSTNSTKIPDDDIRQKYKSEWNPLRILGSDRYRQRVLERRQMRMLRDHGKNSHESSSRNDDERKVDAISRNEKNKIEMMMRKNPYLSPPGRKIGNTLIDRIDKSGEESPIVKLSGEDQVSCNLTVAPHPGKPGVTNEPPQAKVVIEAKQSLFGDSGSADTVFESIAEHPHQSKVHDSYEVSTKWAKCWESLIVENAQIECNEEEKARAVGSVPNDDASQPPGEDDCCLGVDTTNLEATARKLPPLDVHPDGVAVEEATAVPEVSCTMDHESRIEAPSMSVIEERDGTGGSSVENFMIHLFQDYYDDESSRNEAASTSKCTERDELFFATLIPSALTSFSMRIVSYFSVSLGKRCEGIFCLRDH
jgi:hypothetical protein